MCVHCSWCNATRSVSCDHCIEISDILQCAMWRQVFISRSHPLIWQTADWAKRIQWYTLLTIAICMLCVYIWPVLASFVGALMYLIIINMFGVGFFIFLTCSQYKSMQCLLTHDNKCERFQIKLPIIWNIYIYVCVCIYIALFLIICYWILTDFTFIAYFFLNLKSCLTAMHIHAHAARSRHLQSFV